MVDQDTSESGQAATEIIRVFASSLAVQRKAIADRNWDALAAVVPKLQEAMVRVKAFPGGAEGLKWSLSSLGQDHHLGINALLEEAASERLAAAELIRVNIQRLNAIKSLLEHGELAGAETGQVIQGSPGKLVSKRA
ncbi:MAG: hypothetical protein EB072_00790 [Betaproteobacteria bacterium]|nr:hypothetical protein [Betaproteobacteria bacterium]